MTSAQVCGTNNLAQLQPMLYRPLYWFGDNYSPTIDYANSIGDQPVFSDNDTEVSVTLKDWKWSDGEQVDARDIEFFVDMYKADPASNFCTYVPGLFPDNVVSMSIPNPQTIVFHLDKAYNPTWFTYNELSQLSPLPLAWDRTSLTQTAPTSDNGSLPDVTKAGAEAVYKFLDQQSKDVGTWASSPIWSVVDGPFRLQSFTNTGQVTLVPNPDYSGTPKPSISKFVEVPFTDDSATFDVIRAEGPAALTIAGLPLEYAAQSKAVASEGFLVNKASSYSANYFPLNLNNPVMGPVFRQTYFRQALQHLVDQNGWINAFLDHTAVPTYGPIPSSPSSPLAAFNASANPFPFSVTDAKQLLAEHGWHVDPGGLTTCEAPGEGPSECGSGIARGKGLSFNIDYQSGVPSEQSEMEDLQAQAKLVGIDITLTTHPFDTVVSTATQCQPTQPTCAWTAENWGAGWIYAPDFLPTGEVLFQTGAAANYSNYSDAHANELIQSTIHASSGAEPSALATYAAYIEQDLPVVFGPTSIGSYEADAGTLVSDRLGGYVANAFGYLTPEDWYLTK